MAKTLILIDDINYLSQELGLSFQESVVIFWKAGCVDIDSVKILARSVKDIYVSPIIADEVATALEQEISVLESKEITRTNKTSQSERPIALFVANDTIAKMLVNVIKTLKQPLPLFFIVPSTKNEGALDVIDSENLPFRLNKPGLLALEYPSVLILGNDWGDEEKKLISSATRLNIPSVCIQEGCLDWQEKARRMQWATFAFIQGPITVNYLPRTIYFLTGNPRFDSLSPVPLPQKTAVMINSNFTYGIFEDKRDEWINDVVSACNHVEFDFFISQHPRDKREIEGYPVRKSNAGVVHSQIAESSILVSRFSTVIYEAVLMGRQAIYYNPYGETMQLFNEDNTNGIYKAYSRDELLRILEELKNKPDIKIHDRDNFIMLHCGKNRSESASQRCANTINEIKKWCDGFSQKSIFSRSFYFIEEQMENKFARARYCVQKFLKS